MNSMPNPSPYPENPSYPTYNNPPYPMPPQSKPPQYQPPQSQPPQYQPPQYQPPVVVSQPVVYNMVLGRQPTRILCSSCQRSVCTKVHYENGIGTWAVAGIICLFGCWLGCCLIPFCIDSLKDAVHTCPECGASVGLSKCWGSD